MPTIQTSQPIDAPAPTVWGILADLDSWSAWNPFIVEASGALEEGSTLQLKMKPPGGKEMSFKPTVLKVLPEQEIRWKGRLILPGIFDGEHWFRITPEGSGVLLEQGEDFTGILPRFMGKTLRQTELGFLALNEALKARAEA